MVASSPSSTHPEGPGQTQEVGLCEPYEVQKAKFKVLPKSQAQIQAGQRMAGEQPRGEGDGGGGG